MTRSWSSVSKAIAETFSTTEVSIDRTVYSAAQPTKLAGTRARKGENLVGVPGVEDRPHRMATLLSAPEVLEIASKETILAIVEDLEKQIEADKEKANPTPAKKKQTTSTA